MNIKLPSETIFYKIESTIKAYRKFAQQNISEQIENITIDQSISLIYMSKFPDLAQNKLAELVFKDNASLTRMINSMVRKGFLDRSMNEQDRRRYNLEITSEGQEVINKLKGVILKSRSKSLSGVTEAELDQLNHILSKIENNCK